MRFALLEIKVLLAKVLLKYEFQKAENTPVFDLIEFLKILKIKLLLKHKRMLSSLKIVAYLNQKAKFTSKSSQD